MLKASAALAAGLVAAGLVAAGTGAIWIGARPDVEPARAYAQQLGPMNESDHAGMNGQMHGSMSAASHSESAPQIVAHSVDLRAIKKAGAATAPYFDLSKARSAGYAPLADAKGIQCIAQPGSGAMGVHYVRGDLVADPTENPLTPEALVYEPTKGGGLRLVALEYVVIQSDWDATHASPPSLFGHEFMAVDGSDGYGLPPFYALHVWLWKFNPSGLFADYNPHVTCTYSTEAYS